MTLDGKTILVTGAGRRLGRAIALELGRAGAWIAVHHHTSVDGARDVVDALAGQAASYRADLADPGAAEALVDAVVADRGRLDAAVLNASAFPRVPFGDVTPDDWRDAFATNLETPFFLAQRAAPHVRRARGSIVLLGDAAADDPALDRVPYSLAKAAIPALTKALAKALAPDARANAIAPGPVLPPADARPDERDAIARTALLERFGGEASIAHAVRYLIEADFVTGHVLVVDGGRRLRRP